MKLAIATTKPFSFEQTKTFIRRFPGCQAQTTVEGGVVTAAFAAGGRGWAVRLHASGDSLVAELPAGAPRSLVRRAAEWIGAGDDVQALYRRAAGDRAFQPVIAKLHGLHHVRFLGLEDIAVHCVMMQRQSPAQTARMKRRFLEALGHRTGDLHAMPELAELAALEVEAIENAIRHRAKAERILAVVRGVAQLGEDFLRTAGYADAKAALLDVPGIGPFSATAILLRGLGRHDENPVLEMFAGDGRLIYGEAWNEAALAKRYGDQIGYWTYYLKTGAALLSALKD
jgi:DNA-3-methyladenine glycosylase II